MARPGTKLPTRKQLADNSAGELLQECYEKVKVKVKKALSNDGNFVCIATDAWSNIANEPVVNYMAVCPTKSLFLEAVHTEEQGHNAEWLTKDLSRVIDSVGENVVGAVTDNTAANKMWSALEEKYATKFFHGCVAHGLHLVVKEVLQHILMDIHLKTYCCSPLIAKMSWHFSTIIMCPRLSSKGHWLRPS